MFRARLTATPICRAIGPTPRSRRSNVPAEFAGKEFLTEAEAVAYQKKRELQENSQSKEDIHYDNVLWQSESYSKNVSARRSSLIFDPADGKIPPLTPAAQQRAAAQAEAARGRGSRRRRGISQPRRALHLVGKRRTADARRHLLQQPADFPDRQDRGDPPRADARHSRDPARRQPARRAEASRSCTATPAVAGKATRWSSTRPISPTGRRSGVRRRRRGRTFFRARTCT